MAEGYVRGANTRNWKTSRDPVEELLCSIEEMEQCFEDDPAFKDVLYKLDLVEQELDWLTHSAGRRAVLRSAMPNHAGQEPGHRHQEAPMEAQRTDYGS